jgi:hypothetical protein
MSRDSGWDLIIEVNGNYRQTLIEKEIKNVKRKRRVYQ